MSEGAAPERNEGERLQKVLAAAGFGSRRACEELIVEGRVTVDGQVAVIGQRVDTATAQVTVDGVPVSVRPGLVHYLLNKPRGVVVTASDPQGRRTVLDLVPREPRVFPVGRLDADTEGLLILTNDGDLAHRLTHPSYGVEKEYLAEVEGRPTPGEIRRLRAGIELEDGITAPAKASIVAQATGSIVAQATGSIVAQATGSIAAQATGSTAGQATASTAAQARGSTGVQATGSTTAPTAIRLTIHEGRNRQVRRMCAAIGHPVVRLVRVRIGPLAERGLAPGEWRSLTVDEVRALERSVSRR